MTRILMIGAAAAALCGCSMMHRSAPDRVQPEAVSADALPLQAMSYVMKAGASDLYEITSSRLALEQSQDERVRRFAQMMIDHHTTTTREVAGAAMAARLTPPPPLMDPMQEQMIAALQPLTGAEFDAAYLRQQVTAHEMAFMLHRTFGRQGDEEHLRRTAQATVPVVQGHLTEVRGMAAGR